MTPNTQSGRCLGNGRVPPGLSAGPETGDGQAQAGAAGTIASLIAVTLSSLLVWRRLDRPGSLAPADCSATKGLVAASLEPRPMATSGSPGVAGRDGSGRRPSVLR